LRQHKDGENPGPDRHEEKSPSAIWRSRVDYRTATLSAETHLKKITPQEALRLILRGAISTSSIRLFAANVKGCRYLFVDSWIPVLDMADVPAIHSFVYSGVQSFPPPPLPGWSLSGVQRPPGSEGSAAIAGCSAAD
jgi:hypothetical protein